MGEIGAGNLCHIQMIKVYPVRDWHHTSQWHQFHRWRRVMSWHDETCHMGKTGFGEGIEEGIFVLLDKEW